MPHRHERSNSLGVTIVHLIRRRRNLNMATAVKTLNPAVFMSIMADHKLAVLNVVIDSDSALIVFIPDLVANIPMRMI